ncbi:MAG: tRNA 2-thiouridine(34) synthase MnmA [Planctomycetota bacterium]|jgi:tRNA-specific 2-thiouridylase|nr:tRNA 2-thiouridine(34) synthase MnmA [Planctomycetota bacterium]
MGMDVLVALSGGVDSAVAAALVQRQGHRVRAVTMSIWREGRYQGGGRDACFGEGEKEDIAAAQQIAGLLGIPHQVLDCADIYEKVVVDNFRQEYLDGRTPNPCVRCNSLIKFAALPLLARRSGFAFERFATGHYARLAEVEGRCQLRAALDPSRDQSYFLYRLNQEQLAQTMFPLGELRKSEVRRLAGELGLPVAEKPDSQDFYSGDYRELIGVEESPGLIVDQEGKQLGVHSGSWNYTIGQRRGLGISHPDPLYVVEIDQRQNRVVVGTAAAVVRTSLVTRDSNWVSIATPVAPFAAQIKVRSSAPTIACQVFPTPGGDFRAEFPEGIAAVPPGQSAVLYQGDILLGGGVIKPAVEDRTQPVCGKVD